MIWSGLIGKKPLPEFPAVTDIRVGLSQSFHMMNKCIFQFVFIIFVPGRHNGRGNRDRHDCSICIVGCLKGKSESFRLRFVLFTTVRSADFPLFPPSPARFFRILGQNWVKGEKRNWMLIRDSVFHLIIVSVILRANVNMRKNRNTPHTVTSRSAPSGSPPDRTGYNHSDP